MTCQVTYVVEVRGRLAKVSSLLQCESWALNSRHQAWHQDPFSTAPSHSAPTPLVETTVSHFQPICEMHSVFLLFVWFPVTMTERLGLA